MVNRPCWESTGLSPVTSSRKQPVPYVFFAAPGVKHAWPSVAACWSPSIPVIGTPGTTESDAPTPNRADDGSTFGSMPIGTPMRSHMSASHRRVLMSISRVRAAFVTSVACSVPPVRCQSNQVSIVPKQSSPASARCRAPGTSSRIQDAFGPAKYVARESPVLAWKRSGSPSARASTRGWVRVSCHTIALWIASPVARSQMTVVSRWLVMPTAARDPASIPASASARLITSSVLARISFGSCSTQPGCGKIWACSSWPVPTAWPRSSKTIALVLVVP